MTRPLTALPLEVSRCGVWFNGDKEDLQAWRTCMMIRIPWDLVVHWIMGMRKWSQCFQTHLHVSRQVQEVTGPCVIEIVNSRPLHRQVKALTSTTDCYDNLHRARI
jgi:hypothetical protein